jgi:large subunit ribosomal protein L33
VDYAGDGPNRPSSARPSPGRREIRASRGETADRRREILTFGPAWVCLGHLARAFGRAFCFLETPDRLTMAKAANIKIKLLSTADTGFFYVTSKNSRTKTDKLSFRKYDPIAKKHVDFKETKIK